MARFGNAAYFLETVFDFQFYYLLSWCCSNNGSDRRMDPPLPPHLARVKGQYHEIFDSRFFLESVPPSPWVFSNFFKTSWRYSQLKVHHRCRWHQWQMESNLQSEKFEYFVWTPLGSWSYRSIFFFKFTLSCKTVWYCSHYRHQQHLPVPVANLPLVLLIPVENLPPV